MSKLQNGANFNVGANSMTVSSECHCLCNCLPVIFTYQARHVCSLINEDLFLKQMSDS